MSKTSHTEIAEALLAEHIEGWGDATATTTALVAICHAILAIADTGRSVAQPKVAALSKGEHITLGEAADWLRETQTSTRRRVARGELKAYRIGAKRILFKRAEVAALVEPIPAGRNGHFPMGADR